MFGDKGSPPQVRGKPYHTAVGETYARITPAGAGKTAVLDCVRFFTGDHPRRCGENILSALVQMLPAGSPPQVRGKPFKRGFGGCNLGITPAGAGKTDQLRTESSLPEDHPRRCGENFHIGKISHSSIGSPPQVRGKLFICIPLPEFHGITPAGAGKTGSFKFFELHHRDHPRRCGENSGSF